MKNIKNFVPVLKNLILLSCFFVVSEAFGQCPTIQFVDLRGTPGFPQTDDLNVCGEPDTLSILIFTDAPGQVKGFEFTVNMVSGMRYAGFEEAHYGGCTSLSNTNPDINSPEFVATGITCGDIFTANIGVTADCSVDLESNDYLIEIEYSYTYFPPTGGSIKCKGVETLENDFNGALKESVLNMTTPSPIDATVRSLGTPTCQTLTISQDGLQAYLSEFKFAVCGVDIGPSSPVSVSSMTANGMDVLSTAVFSPADTSLVACIDSSIFPANGSTNPNGTSEQFDTNEKVAFEICYEVANCPSGADIPFTYKAWYGCFDEVCQQTGQASFMKIRPSGSQLPTITATLDNGITICGDDAKVSATVTNPNSDTDQNVYTDLSIGFQACGMEAFQITDVMINGVSVPPVFMIVGDDIDIDLSMNTDPNIGLSDYDGDGFFDDLPGGAPPLNIMVSFSLACGTGIDGGCPEINCENVQFYLKGKTNCGNNFQGFPPTGGFNLQYGQQDVSFNGEVPFNTAGTVVGYDFGKFSNAGPPVGSDPAQIEVEFCYEFGKQNIEDCPSGGDTKMLAHFAGPQVIIEDIAYVPGSAMMDDGSGYVAVADGDVSLTLTSPATATLEINRGENTPTLCYKYMLELDECSCGPNQIVAVDQQIVSVCSDCTPDCEIVKGCGSTLFRADPECSPCPCVAQYTSVKTERKNLGYVDKEMTRKITRDELLAANAVDLNRFMPGDTLWHQGYWELLDEDQLLSDPMRWNFFWYASTIAASGTSGEVQAALPLTWEGGSMNLNELKIENPDGSMHIADLSLLAGCQQSPTEIGATLNSLSTHFNTPWPEDPNDPYPCAYGAWEGYDNDYTTFEFWNYQRMRDINEANPSIGIRENYGNGDCLTEFIEAYDIVVGTKLHYDWCVPLIKNPLREAALILGVAPPEQNIVRIVPGLHTYKADPIAGNRLYAYGPNVSGCGVQSTYAVSCPGGITSETNIVLDNCGGTIEHEFVVEKFAGPPGDEWFTEEYRPLIELHDLELPIMSPLAYCAGAEVSQNGLVTPVVVDSTINMSCSPVGGYSDDLCAVDSGSEGAIVIDLFDQGFKGLGIGLGNCDTIRLSYDYCMICPEPLQGLLDYQVKADWCYTGGLPNECHQSNSTFYNPRNDGGPTTLGDEASAQGYLGATWHNRNYYNLFNLDTLYCKEDDTQGIVFIDDSAVTSMMSVATTNEGNDLIAAESAGTSVEAQEVMFCNNDPMDATGFSGYVTVPNPVEFKGVCLVKDDPSSELVSTLISDDGQIKKYKIDMPVTTLAPGECVTAFVKTTLLFCPTPGSLPPEICVGASSGCSPDDVRAAIGGGGACSASEICYAYLFGEAGIQTEWFSMPDDPKLCETMTLHVRTKNVKALLLTGVDPNFTLPFGMSLVPGSWEVAYPGGAVDMTGNFGPWTSVPDPDDVNGFDYGWTNEADWSSEIAMDGLKGVASALDSNNVAFRFQVTTNCDEFLSGSKPRTETLAADPCGPGMLSSGDVESPAIIIDGADPADFAQILAVGSPSELYCGGLDNQFGLTALNVSDKPTTDSVVTCLLIPGDYLDYVSGSVMFTNGFMPAWMTETPIGNDIQVCFHSPDLQAGEAWSVTFEAAMKPNTPCVEIPIGADIKSVVESATCVPGPPDECDVFVQNSLNPVILVDLQAPIKTEGIRVSADCTASEDPLQVCYEVDLSNPGPAYSGNIRIGIHDDVTANGTLETFDTELNGMDHAVSLASGEMITLSMCLDVAAIQSCPIIIKQTYETDCSCDSEETPIMDLSPSFIADLQECVVLCPTQPLELETCGGYDVTLEPAAGGVIADDGTGNLSIVLNDGFGIAGTDPVKLVVTGTTGECEIMDMVELKSLGDWVPTDKVADICENDCVDLDLEIPAELEDGATITWTPALGLDDPTSATPELCDLTADQVYNVEIAFGESCVFNIEYEVTYNPNGVTTITGEEFCLCQEAGTLTGQSGFASYEWYSIQSGAEILEALTTTNTWNGPTEAGDYFLKAYLPGAICPNVSNVVTLEGKECVDLELTKEITNIPTPVVLGSQITYEITVCNIADEDLGLKFDATNVEVSDELPGAVTYVQHTQTSGNYSPTTNQWDITTLANGTCETLSIDVTIDETGTIENTAQVSGADQEDIDSTPNNDDGDQSEDEEDAAVIEVVCESLSGEIFYDNDNDDCQDADEGLVMETINVSLYECGAVPGTDPPVAMTQVMDGEYEFGVDSEDVGADLCLQAGTEYFVVFDIPNAANQALEDYTFSEGAADPACQAAGNSDDVDPATGASGCYDPSDSDAGDGEGDNNIDAGITPPCYEMAGEIFYDDNNDGCQDPGEGLVDDASIEVSIYECGDTPGVDQPQATTTVSDGEYEFGPDSDDPGADICLENDTEYFVVFDIPNAVGESLEEYSFSENDASGACAVSGESDNVDPSTGQSGCYDPDNDDGSDGNDDQNVDAGITPPCETLGGEIFYDTNGNGCEDGTESLVMEPINIMLFECGDDPSVDPPAASTTVTDGEYEFGPDSDDPGAEICLEPGTEYFVVFDIPMGAGEALDGYEFTQGTASASCEATGGADDVDPSTGQSGCYDPNDDDGADGNDDNSIDAGITPPCEMLGGEIFYDYDDDGCQDDDEMLVMMDVNVSLYECGDTPGVDPPAAATTVSDGEYMFGEGVDDPGADICLEAGTEYFVVFDIPNASGEDLEGYDFSSGTADPACALGGDSDDVNPATGASGCYDPSDDDGGDGNGDNNIDAGITPPCESLGGEIFYDDDMDGCEDSNESLVTEVIGVMLYECGDTPGVDAPAASTFTNDGMYEFGPDSDDPGADICLMPGTQYFVVFDIPNGAGESLEDYMVTMGTADAGCEALGESSDVDPTTGQSGCYDPNDNDSGDGTGDSNVDVGISPPCESLSGEIFYDDNRDGCQDPNESLVDDASIEVSIYECGDTPGIDQPAASTTVSDGMYEFGPDSDDPGADICLEAGTEYFVVFDIPSAAGEALEDYSFTEGVASGSCATAGQSDNTDSTTGASGCYDPADDDGTDGNDDNNIDAGITPPCETLGGEVFYDGNENGCQDPNEMLVMEPINVTLYECGDMPGVDPPAASTTITDGEYEFGPDSDDPGAEICLEPDTEYFVVFDIPNAIGEALEEYEFTSGMADAACEAAGESSDVDPATGATGCEDPGADGGDENMDAGIVPPCEQISGEIFYDLDENGCQDMGESLVMEDINVSLYECGDDPAVDFPVASTTVNDGMYAFGETSDDPGADVCLEAGTEYFVVFDIPNAPGEPLEAFEFTMAPLNPSCAAAGESDDVNPATGTSGCYDPNNDDGEDGNSDENVDAGIVPPCEEIAGEIFIDEDNNGCQDPGESLVMTNVTVSLYECGDVPGVDMPAAITMVTDGEYEFGEDSDDPGADICLAPNVEYFVHFDLPNGAGESLEDFTFSEPEADAACAASGQSDDVDSTTGSSDCYDPSGDDDDGNVDAGIVPPCESLGGEIFVDENRDGCEDADESLAMFDVEVSLYACGDTPGVDQPLASTTVSDGQYEFGEDSDDPGADICLEAGTEYFVAFDLPNAPGEAAEDYEFTPGVASGACALDGESDNVDPATGTSGCYDPDDSDSGDGDDDNNIDAGISPPCESIGGEIFYDDNANGCQDGSESLVMESINVMLYECGQTPGVDAPLAMTNVADGMYEFGEDSDDTGADVCLDAGTEYFVVFDIPMGANEVLDGFEFTDGMASNTCMGAGQSDDLDPTTGASGCYDPNDDDGGDGDGDSNIDAGITAPCESLAGEIFIDANNDGCEDASEPLATFDIEVSLYECGDTPGVDQPIASTTVSDGEYEFGIDSDDPGADVCLQAGTEYFVAFDLPNAPGEEAEGFEFTSGTASGACEAAGESDNVDPTTGASGCYDPSDDDVGDGDDDENIDAGITPPCESLGGEIFYDDNGNGCQDGGESLVMESINVMLYECGQTPGVDAPVAQTNVSDGMYMFGMGSDDPGADMCLEAGTQYFVVFDIPMGANEVLDGFEFTDGAASATCAGAGQSDDVDPTTGASGCYDPNDDDGGDGNSDNNIDAGITAPCESLGGEIFVDENRDGCEDSNESLAMFDIEVSLYECGDTPGVDQPIASTTVSDGEYEFGLDSDDPGADICLDGGTEYFVAFDIPNGVGEAAEDYEFTEGVASGACEAAGESDNVDPTTGASGCYDPSDDDSGDGDDDNNIDAGISPPCESLGGEIFYDDNANGCQDGGESLVMESINVMLYECGQTPGVDAPVAMANVADGMYEFGEDSDDTGADVCLEAGTEYFVVFDIPMGANEVLDGYAFTEGTAGATCAGAGQSDDVDPTTGASGCYDPNDDDGGDSDSDNNIDAGISAPCESLGGEIFYDTNGNGCEDSTESLVMESINVSLYECGDTPGVDQPTASTTVTDGAYEFGPDSDDEGAGVCLDGNTEYFVVFDIPSGIGEALEDYSFTQGEADPTCAASGNSDNVDPATGSSSCHNPSDDDAGDGDDDNNIDAGIMAPCESISGEIFYDNNGNGCQDGSESLVMEAINVSVYECGDTPGTDAPVASTSVNDGEYMFGMGSDDPGADVCLDAGTEYFVVFDIPMGPSEVLDGYEFTSGAASPSCETAGGSDDVDPTTGYSDCYDPNNDDVSDGNSDENVDAGITAPCESLGGEIFVDENRDGCEDSNESLAMFDIEVSLYECGDTPGIDQPIASTTVSDGEYEFGIDSDDPGADICLDAGTEYFVAFDIPNGVGEAAEDYEFTAGVASGACEAAGESDNVDSTTGASGCYDPSDDDSGDGDDDNNIDAGISPPCESLGGEIFYDNNENGCQDGSESLVMESINVMLYECGQTPGVDAPVAMTNVFDGMYEFGMDSNDPGANMCLDAGTQYFVVFDIPMGAGEVLDGYEFSDGSASASCTGAGQSDDVDPTTGASGCYDPNDDDSGDGGSDENIDAGITPPCEQIAGEIFYDDNNNGCQDPNETLVDDQTIEVVLYECGDVPGLDQPEAFTSTSDGMYEFGINSDDPGADLCLEAGKEYFVEFHIPNAPGEPLEDYYFSENIAAPACLFSGEGDNIDPSTGQSGCHDPSNTDGGDGNADENIDAGIVHPCEILGGEIFYDYDNDGCHDDSESLVTDPVDVTLFECGDDPATATPVASTTTTDGTYQFGDEYSLDSTDDPCLNPRKEYFVVFDFNDSAGAPLEDHYFSDGEADVACTAAGGSDDVDSETGESACYGPDDDDDDNNIDAGITPCEEISGEVFYDWNANGCQDDASETPVEGVDVYIFNCNESNPSPSNALASSSTNADGEYAFGPEEEGSAEICLHPDEEYFVMFDIPNGDGEQHEDFYPTDGDGSTCAGSDTGDDTYPTTGTTGCYDPDGDDDDDDVDMGITPCEEIGGEVFYDNNGDGCQDDSTEGPVPGVNVYVFECGTTDTSPANALASDVTNADGEYDFGPEEEGDANVCLDPMKEYFVVFDIPTASGEQFDDFAITDGDGSTCAGGDNGDDVDPATGASDCHGPDGDDDDDDIDLGIMPCEELAGEVYYDDNVDGCQNDGEEVGVPGVDVYLFECGTTDTSPSNALASATTDDDGQYKFGSGEPGNADICLDANKEYFVLFDLPNGAGEELEGFEFTEGTGATCAGDGAADDVDQFTGESACYDPSDADGDDDNNIDAGITGCQEMGGTVFYDDNADGCQDPAAEVGVEGVTAYIYNCNEANPTPGNALASTTTDGDGDYMFGPKETGSAKVCLDRNESYYVVFDIPNAAGEAQEGYDFTDGDSSSCARADNSDDVNPSTGQSGCYNPNDDDSTDGEDDNSVDAGIGKVDVALVKTIVTPGPYAYNQLVTFQIEVFNQGSVDLYNVKVNDFIPCGYNYVSAGNEEWSYNPSTGIATTTVAGPIKGQSSEILTITLEVAPCSQSGAYTNVAEVESMANRDGEDITGADIDSTGDADPSNDLESDNMIGNEGGDEDDADPATIEVFDLALIKELITPPVYENGDVLEYRITVVNQGNIAATNIEVWDHLPAGLVSDASQNTAWDATLAPSYSQVITDVVAPGESVSVSFFGIINYVGSNQEDYVNYAEIGGATDQDGNAQTDADSTPDNDPTNDGTPVDDQLTDRGDEDDHDPEGFDLVSEFIPPCEAPCDMNCNAQLNLSLRESDCSAEVLPNMLIPGIDEACNDPQFYTIRLIDEHGDVIPGNVVTLDYLGQNITYEVYNNTEGCGNMCWGNILIEYKHLPQIDCPMDMTLSCGALDMLPLPDVSGGGACNTDAFEIFLADEVREKIECGEPGAEEFTHRVTRTYVATDALGNTASCEHTIMLERIDLSGLEFPLNAVVMCSDLDSFIIADSGAPLPWLTSGLTGEGLSGVPVICYPDLYTTTGLVCPSTGSGTGIPLIPQTGATIITENGPELMAGDVVGNCSAAITYTDVALPQIGCTKKVLRTWEIREWYCSTEIPIGPYVQQIEIVDNVAPVVECPAPFMVTTNDDCAGDIDLPSAVTSDACDNGTNVVIEHPWGRVEGNGGMASLEVGTHVLTYKVSDDCGNSTQCTTTVTIRDNTEPVAICEQNTVVSISQNGNTIISSDVFDDGSWDECGEVTTCAMKMDDVLRFRGLSVDTVFQGIDYVEVSRMDNGCLHEYVSGVTLDGIDYISEADLCVPYIRFCCTDVGVDQMVIFRAKDHGGNSSDCMVNVEIQDKAIPSLTCPDDVTIDCRETYALDNLGLQFGEPVINDNCADTQPMNDFVDADINQCGIGTITRRFEVTDALGNVVRSCKQVITIGNDTPFAGDIEWPLDFESACGTAGQLVPEALDELFAYPRFIVGDDQCSLLGFDYDDEYFAEDPLTGECGVIRRSWTVIDWCNQVNGQFVTYPLSGPYVQTIKITNDVAPEIVAQEDLVFSSNSIDCQNGDIAVSRTATDDCTPTAGIDWSYVMTNSAGNVVEADADGTVLSGDTAGFSGVFAADTYSIAWTACDGCGNCTSTTQVLEVVNTKAPIPICMNGLSITLDNQGNAELWASDVDGGSYHPCGNEFTVGFNDTTSEQVLFFDCTHEGEQLVRLYLRDTRTGINDFCVARIEVQDPLNVCVQERVVVSGEVFTEEMNSVEDVKVEMAANMPHAMTNANGEYAFADMPMGGRYDIKPEKDTDYLNGVSTLDLILIQRHILGLEVLDSPYKMIAADVDGNKNINGIDLVELRKLILGIYMDLPTNDSWRFVDAGYEFIDELNPWKEGISENYEIISLDSNMDIDFIGVKVGDVNGSAETSSALRKTEIRGNRWPVVLEMEDTKLKAGEVESIAFYGRNYEGVSGWQTTFEFDYSKMEIVEVISKSLELTEANINLSAQTEGWVTVSYHNLEVEDKDTSEPLFELVIKAKDNLDSKNLLEVSSKVTSNEAYRGYDQIVDMQLDVRVEETTRINSINPNPWITETSVEFHMPESGVGVWEFYDVNGRVIYRKTGQYEAGTQVMKLRREEIEGAGIIYMKLTTDQGIAEHKMILVK